MTPARIKKIVRSIYVFRCGYCGITERDAGAELTFDHFKPQVLGGKTDVANLIYACQTCNSFKHEYYNESAQARLLHPLNDDLTEHPRTDREGTLQPLTTLGGVYIEVLHLNRAPLILSRLEDRYDQTFLEEPRKVNVVLDSLLERIASIENRLRIRHD